MKNKFQPLPIIAPVAVKAALKQSELLQKHSAYPQVIELEAQIYHNSSCATSAFGTKRTFSDSPFSGSDPYRTALTAGHDRASPRMAEEAQCNSCQNRPRFPYTRTLCTYPQSIFLKDFFSFFLFKSFRRSSTLMHTGVSAIHHGFCLNFVWGTGELIVGTRCGCCGESINMPWERHQLYGRLLRHVVRMRF